LIQPGNVVTNCIYFIITRLFFFLSKWYTMYFEMSVRIKFCLNTEPFLTLTLVDCHFYFSGDCIYTGSIGTENVSSGHSGSRWACTSVVVKVLLDGYFYTIFCNCLHQPAVCVQCKLEVLPIVWTLYTAPHTLIYGLIIVCYNL
jgi:hypothetical protein